MFLPEYSVTPNILNSIGLTEYNRAIIENTNILQSFETRMEKDALTDFIVNSLVTQGELPNEDVIKKYIDGIAKVYTPQIVNLKSAEEHITTIASRMTIEEKDLKFLHSILSKNILNINTQGTYRSMKLMGKVEPETILAEINDLIDWYNSLDAKDTNPIIVAGIFKGQLETIFPFERYNQTISNVCTRINFESRGYRMHKYISPEIYYSNSRKNYETKLSSIIEEENDFTSWLEYFTESIATQTAMVAEKVKLYSRDTKLAKANGRLNLSPRQAKIVEYLQDYGLLRNTHFPLLFPDISEDSVLRDLNKLVEEGIVVKLGKTKSSRYELK